MSQRTILKHFPLAVALTAVLAPLLRRPQLARLLAAGQLRPVVVPAPELEALRDLVRAREDLRGDLRAPTRGLLSRAL